MIKPPMGGFFFTGIFQLDAGGHEEGAAAYLPLFSRRQVAAQEEFPRVPALEQAYSDPKT